MWTATLACSPAWTGSEQRPGPQGSLFPFLALLPSPPTHTHTHTHRTPPWWGRAWQRAAVCGVCALCVCVCVCVNFLFYRGSSVRMYRSLFRFSLRKKQDRKKDCVNSHESVWETTSIVSGKLPCSLSKNIFCLTCEVQTQSPNQTLRSMSFRYSSQRTFLKHYQLLSSHIKCSTFFP